MSGGAGNSKPAVYTTAEARSLLASAGFERLMVNKTELWQNKHGKVVFVQYADDTYESYWAETVDEAIKCKDAKPTHF